MDISLEAWNTQDTIYISNDVQEEGVAPGKAQCSSVGEYHDREVERVDWGTGEGKRAMGLSGRGDPGKGKSLEM